LEIECYHKLEVGNQPEMPKQRNKPEFIVELSNTLSVYLNQIGDINGDKCFLITDTAGSFNSFVITAEALPLEGERLTTQQETIARQLIATTYTLFSKSISTPAETNLKCVAPLGAATMFAGTKEGCLRSVHHLHD
jgi:hypothetical protein